MKLAQQGFNSLWPSDVTRRNRTWSTMVQVMARYLTAQSRYMNRSWLIINEVLSYMYPWYEIENHWFQLTGASTKSLGVKDNS